jgi:hypothetical protein
MFIEITKRFSKLNLWRFTITSYAFMGENLRPIEGKKVPEGKREIQFKSDEEIFLRFRVCAKEVKEILIRSILIH